MNDIDNEAGTDGSAFVWIDGSNSTYRNFGTLGEVYPVLNTDFNCVRHRYRGYGFVLSQGWLNALCSNTRNCYFCSRAGKHSSVL